MFWSCENSCRVDVPREQKNAKFEIASVVEPCHIFSLDYFRYRRSRFDEYGRTEDGLASAVLVERCAGREPHLADLL